MDMPPEVVEQLLDPGPNLSLSFCFLTDPVLRTFLYRCRMVHADGGLWCNAFWKAVYVSRRLMAIKPMTALNLSLVCDIIHNAERTDSNFIKLFISSFFGAWDVSTCHYRNLYRTKKAAHYKNFQQFAFEWYVSHVSTIPTFRDIANLYHTYNMANLLNNCFGSISCFHAIWS